LGLLSGHCIFFLLLVDTVSIFSIGNAQIPLHPYTFLGTGDNGLIKSFSLQGSIIHAKLSEEIGRVYLEIDNASGSHTVELYNIYTGERDFTVSSATCPSFNKNGSIFIYWDENQEEGVLNKIYGNKIEELGRFESDSRPCPTISENGNILAVDRNFPNDYYHDGYELFIYRLSDFYNGFGNISDDSTLIKTDRGCDDECFVHSIELTSEGDRILFNIVVENDDNYSGKVFLAESKDNYIPRVLQQLRTQKGDIRCQPFGTMSSDGKAIVFQNTDSYDNEIYILNVDKKLTRLTDNKANDHSPKITADAKSVVFWHDNDIDSILLNNSYKMKVKTIVDNVSISSESFYSPVLEIDNDIMLYSANYDTNNTLTIMNTTK